MLERAEPRREQPRVLANFRAYQSETEIGAHRDHHRYEENQTRRNGSIERRRRREKRPIAVRLQVRHARPISQVCREDFVPPLQFSRLKLTQHRERETERKRREHH